MRKESSPTAVILSKLGDPDRTSPHGPGRERAGSTGSPNGAKGSRRKAASLEICFAAGLCGVVIHGREIGLFEIGMFIQNLFFGHSRVEPAEYVPHRKS